MSKLESLIPVLLAAVVALPVAAAEEGDALGVGQAAWYEHCTVCHGRDGSGDGPFVPLLRTAPPDLTVLARDNGGEFPLDRVLRAVDGRNLPLAHGGGDMPLWGRVLSAAGECEERVRSRVVDVVAWLRTLQR
ncbi:MAG: cytochrome C [Gammaproteobacteria bacterium]